VPNYGGIARLSWR